MVVYDGSASGCQRLYMPTSSPNTPIQVSFRSVPCISVFDIQQSVDYYCQKLGFSQEWIHVDQAGNTAMVGLQRNGIEIFLDRKVNQSNFGLQLYRIRSNQYAERFISRIRAKWSHHPRTSKNERLGMDGYGGL